MSHTETGICGTNNSVYRDTQKNSDKLQPRKKYFKVYFLKINELIQSSQTRVYFFLDDNFSLEFMIFWLVVIPLDRLSISRCFS